MKPGPEAVESAKQAYKDQQRHVELIYANAGKKLNDPKLWAILESVDRRDWQWGWLMHELSLSRNWLEQNLRTERQLRRAWVQARLDAGEEVAAYTLDSVGLEQPTQPREAE